MKANAGLRHGRDWTDLPDDEAVVDWNVQPEQGLIQGPLDLDFLRGRRVFLTLDEGQVALLINDDRVQAVYLDGGHVLDIGHGRGQVPCDGSIVFLSIGQGLDVRWSAAEPLTVNGGTGLIGHCTLEIAGAGRFYDTFLAGSTAWDEEFVLRLVRQAALAAMERFLDGAEAEPGRLQARLANLEPEDLDEELAPLGLKCRAAAWYTAEPPVEVAPVATTGQFGVPRHN